MNDACTTNGYIMSEENIYFAKKLLQKLFNK